MNDTTQDTGHPDWYVEGYKKLEQFQALSHEERGELIARASALFGTLMTSLTPEGRLIIATSGKHFLDMHKEIVEEQFGEIDGDTMKALIIGAMIETIGILQMQIEGKSA